MQPNVMLAKADFIVHIRHLVQSSHLMVIMLIKQI